MNAADITEALGGRWYGDYGMAPCPAHKDRRPSLSITDGRDGKVLFNCFAGCHWTAIRDALERRRLLDQTAHSRFDREQERQICPSIGPNNPNTGKARALWAETQPIAGTVVERYLIGRALRPPFPPSLRYHSNLKHGPTGLFFPALVAAVQGPDDEVTAVQRTFLLPDGRGKAQVSDPKMTLGSIGPGAVRLAAAGPALGIAEGIETGLSAMQIFRVPVWAALGSRLDKIALPGIVRRVIIFADQGAAGLRAANKAVAVYTRQRRKVDLKIPPFGDWNDALRAKGAA